MSFGFLLDGASGSKLAGVEADSTGGCQVCGGEPVLIDDVLCAACAGPVQLSWGLAHSRGALRGEEVRWNGRRRPVETVPLNTEVL